MWGTPYKCTQTRFTEKEMGCEQVLIIHTPDNFFGCGDELPNLQRKNKLSRYSEFVSWVKVQIMTCRCRLVGRVLAFWLYLRKRMVRNGCKESCPKFKTWCVCLSLFPWAAAYTATASRQCLKLVLKLIPLELTSPMKVSFPQMNSYEVVWLFPGNGDDK